MTKPDYRFTFTDRHHPNAHAWLANNPHTLPVRTNTVFPAKEGTVFYQGVDFAFGNGLTTGQLLGAGKRFVCRYLSGGNSKDISAAELANYKAAGIAVVLNWETTGTMTSFAQGVSEAQAADAEARGLGHGSDPITFSADFDPTNNTAGIVAFMQGVVSVIGKARAGIYGGYAAMGACAGICTFFWQTYAWSAGKLSPYATLYQYSNNVGLGPATVDLDEALSLNFGQIGSAPVPLPPFATPANLTAVPHAGGVTLNWSAVAGAAGGYMYEVLNSAGVLVVPGTDTPGTSVSVNLAPGTYSAKVVTHNTPTHTWSAWSAPVVFIVPFPPFPAPANFTFAETRQVKVSWPAVPGATAYEYEVQDPAGNLLVNATNVLTNGVTITIPAGAGYMFRAVTHVSPSNDWSAWSPWTAIP